MTELFRQHCACGSEGCQCQVVLQHNLDMYRYELVVQDHAAILDKHLIKDLIAALYKIHEAMDD